MEIPTKEIIEAHFLPGLKDIFKKTELNYIDDMEFSYYEICYNEELDGFITIDNEALEISMDYAFFRFIYAPEDRIAYKVVGTDYETKGIVPLFNDALDFIKKNLLGAVLEMQYTHSAHRLIKYELYRINNENKELLYSYKFTSLPDLFFKPHLTVKKTLLE